MDCTKEDIFYFIKSKDNATHTSALENPKKITLHDGIYPQIKKSLTYIIATIGELVPEKDQVLYLLDGFGTKYDPIVASPIAHEDDINLHSIHSILLVHKQKNQCDEVFTTHIAT